MLRLASDATRSKVAAHGPNAITREAGVSGAGPGPVGNDAPEVDLRVLATSDLHANVLSYDYSSNRPLFGLGLSQMASLIAAARADHPDSLLLDNGDFLQGTALADLAATPRRRRAHPVILAMNALGYDAAALGNHEFNFGLELLLRVMAQAQFPLLSANIVTSLGEVALDDDTLVPPFVILTRRLPDQHGAQHDIRIGVLGLTPPEVLNWDREHLNGRIETRAMVDSARAWVPYMRRRGADVVVCLAHTGLADKPGQPGSDTCAADLACIEGVDALVAGHSHKVFPHRGHHPNPAIQPSEGMVHGIPVVQPGYNGSHLGVLDLRLRRRSGGWSVVHATARADSVSEVVAGLPAGVIRRNAEPLRRAVQADHRATLDWTRQRLGHSALAMSTCFASVADVPALRLLAKAKTAHVSAALRGTPDADLPLLCLVTPFRSGGRGGALNYSELPAGALTQRHLFNLYPFPNMLVAYRTTVAHVTEILERSAAQFLRIVPGRPDQMLIDPTFPHFAFSAVLGLTYRIDPSRPARFDVAGAPIKGSEGRIRDLRRDGRELAPDDRVILVSNSFRTGGAQGMSSPFPEDVVVADRTLCTDVLRRFIEGSGPITADLLRPDRDEGWRIEPMPGTSVLFDTGAMAEGHVSEAAQFRPEYVGLTTEGFRRYRLHL